MDHPKVTVVELPPLEGKSKEGRPVNLGGSHSLEAGMAEEYIQSLMSAAKAASQRIFELTWEGSKIPRGAKILGKEIVWTQNGMVTVEGGENIGTYERLEEYGGPNQKTQKMRIYVAAKDENPDKN